MNMHTAYKFVQELTNTHVKQKKNTHSNAQVHVYIHANTHRHTKKHKKLVQTNM
jgi:hypothetical protein